MKRSILLILLGSLAACAGKSKPPESSVLMEGYQKAGNISCYYAPSKEGLSPSEVRTLHRQILYDAKAHWRGEIEPTLKFSENTVDRLEDQILIHPEDLKAITDKNSELCQTWGGVESSEGYEKALLKYANSLDKGRCETQLLELYSTHLSVNLDWQGSLTLCGGQRVTINLSDGQYTLKPQTVDEPAQYIGAEGAVTKSAKNGSYPCQEDGCFPGMVIGRFQPWAGEAWIFPIGRNLSFQAPSNGELSVRVNDNDYSDNHFYQEDQVLDFLTFEVSSDQ